MKELRQVTSLNLFNVSIGVYFLRTAVYILQEGRVLNIKT